MTTLEELDEHVTLRIGPVPSYRIDGARRVDDPIIQASIENLDRIALEAKAKSVGEIAILDNPD